MAFVGREGACSYKRLIVWVEERPGLSLSLLCLSSVILRTSSSGGRNRPPPSYLRRSPPKPVGEPPRPIRDVLIRNHQRVIPRIPHFLPHPPRGSTRRNPTTRRMAVAQSDVSSVHNSFSCCPPCVSLYSLLFNSMMFFIAFIFWG